MESLARARFNIDRGITDTDATVWFARPEESSEPARRAELMSLLSDDEKERMVRLEVEPKRELFLLGHGLLRTALSRQADVNPIDWRFSAGIGGRPEILSPSSRLRFSLSHTRGLVACAVSIDREIGLDVEDTSNARSIALADRYFSPRERQDLRRAPAAEQAARFYEYWTLKEAYLKACGAGLSLPLETFAFHCDRDGRWEIAFAPSIDDDPSRWRFWSWRIGALHQAALALSTYEPPDDPHSDREQNRQ